MSVTAEHLSEEEAYLVAILTDASGLDLAEFTWVDYERDDLCWRAYPYQWAWWRDESPMQIDQCARSVGKSLSILARAMAFPFAFPGQEMLITAPELVHLEPITSNIEQRYHEVRLTREMINSDRSAITHRPFQMNLQTGSRIMGRIPQITGRGVKGQHPVCLELDEAQDYPEAGWTELIETVKVATAGAVWRAHGVTRGIRDKFYDYTQDTPDNDWKVHRITAIHRPNWTDAERQKKIKLYGGSREHPDYRRNVLGLHGDHTNPLFVLHRLMRCVDQDVSTFYNEEEYQNFNLKAEVLEDLAGPNVDDQIDVALSLLSFSQAHKKYKTFWCGMDVGYTAAPSEILVFAEYHPSDREMKEDSTRVPPIATPHDGNSRLKLVARLHLQRIGTPIQARIIEHVVDFYEPQAFGMDKMQPVSEPVLTPSGWRPIGDLSVGDSVIGSNGRPTRVTGVYPQTDRRVCRVTFNDGSWTRCGPEHLWVVEDAQGRGQNKDRRIKVTTEELAVLVGRQQQRRYRLPMLSGPVNFDGADDLPVDPYLLGVLLGDGNLRRNSVRISTADSEILAEIEARVPVGVVAKPVGGYDYELASVEGYRRGSDGRFIEGRNPLVAALRALDLAGLHAHEKFVPEQYLRAEPEARLALLRGIMDTDGWVTPAGKSSCIGFRSSSKRLADGVAELVESLGGSVRRSTHPTSCHGRSGRTAHKLIIAIPEVPFKLSRKVDAVVPRKRPVQRFVDRIEMDEPEDSVCIRVEADDHLYVTRHHLLTHNTGNGLPLFQSLESRPTRVGKVIRGYDFAAKVIVGIDGTIEVTDHDDPLKEAALKNYVLEYSTDKLREYVDNGRLLLPFDKELIGEFQGQTWSYSKVLMDAYGRRRRTFSQGEFHALDAARMAAMAHAQHAIEAFIEAQKRDTFEPILDVFLAV